MLNDYERNQKEVARLQKCYPLFKFTLDKEPLNDIDHVNNLEIQYSIGHSYYTPIVDGRLKYGELDLIKEHMEQTIANNLMELYHDLYFSLYTHRNGITISVWVKRDNRDCESVGQLDIISTDLHETLKRWQIEATRAKQTGWFFCSGHTKAEPKSEYGYFHFAGNYCKKYGDEHPDQRKEAGRQSYE